MRAIPAELQLVLVTLIAAGGWLFSKQALEEFQPFTFVALRFFLAGVVLAAFCWRGLCELKRADWYTALFVGLVFALSMGIWISALYRADSIGEGAFIVSLSVVLVPLIGRLIFADAISPLLLSALPPAVFGLALLTLNRRLSLDANQSLFFVATIGFAFHLVLSSRFAVRIAPLILASIQLSVVGVVAGLAAWWLEPQFTALLRFDYAISATAWSWLLCSSLLATSLRFALQTEALSRVGASQASMIFVLEPVWTASLGALVLAERMTLTQLIGCGFILLALLIYRASWLKVFWRRFRQ